MTELSAMKAEINAINSKYADVPGYSPVDVTADSFNMFDSTYKIREEDGRAVFDADFKVAKVRPYLGLGFGRSMPKSIWVSSLILGCGIMGKCPCRPQIRLISILMLRILPRKCQVLKR